MKSSAFIITMALTMPVNASSYYGAEVGWGILHNACDLNFPCNKDNFIMGALMGYEHSPYLAVELNFNHLSNVTANDAYNNKNKWINSNLNILSVAPKLTLPTYQDLDIYATLGMAYVQFGDYDDIVSTAALGLEYSVNRRLSARLELSHLQEISNGPISGMTTNWLTFGFTFGLLSQISPPIEAINGTATFPKSNETPITQHTNSITLYYDLNQTRVDSAALKRLDNLVDILQVNSASSIKIVGHTDNRGSEKYNLELSFKRANYLAQYFINKGISTERIIVVARGEGIQVDDNKARNRRVEITIETTE